MSNKKAVYIILFALCILVYANSIKGVFVCDDIPTIVKNPQASQFLRMYTEPQQLCNGVAFSISGLNPWSYHLISVVLHCINTLLVFSFLRLFFQAEASLIAACLFAVHPIHTEAVSWISGRPYLFLSLYFLSIYFLYQKGMNLITAGRKSGLVWYIMALAIFSYGANFSISSAAFMVFLPFILILSDILFSIWRRKWKWWIPFLVILIIQLILAKDSIIYHRNEFMTGGIKDWIIERNPARFFVFSVCAHLWLLIWPQHITISHGPEIIHPSLITFYPLCLFVIFIGLILALRKDKRVFFALSVFILMLAPTYSPVSLGCIIAERFLYFPSILFFMILAYLYEKYLPVQARPRRYAIALLISLIALYGIRTVVRNKDYYTEEAFWRKAIEVSPGNSGAHNSLGLVYIDKRNLNGALKEFQEAIRFDPANYSVNVNLAGCYLEMGLFNQALFFAQKAQGLRPDQPQPLHAISRIYDTMGNKSEAIVYLKKLIEAHPEYLYAYDDLGAIYTGMGKSKDAIPLLKRALEINPRYGLGHYDLAAAYFHEKNYPLAIEHCDAALKWGYPVPQEFIKELAPYRKL